MKHWKHLLSVAAAATLSHAAVSAPEAVPGEFVIKMKKAGISTMSVNTRLADMGIQVVEQLDPSRDIYLAKTQITTQGVNDVDATAAVVHAVSSLQGVEYIEPNYIYRTSDVEVASDPNNVQFKDQWALKNVGQNGGAVGADVSANKAWAISTGSENVIVAVVDTGIDYTHPNLKNNIWNKPGTDNVHGVNTVTDKEDPMDDNNHGTHCAGVIGAEGNTGSGIAGINWHVKLMGAKFLTASGSGSVATAVKAIAYATDNGARVISASWGGGGFSQALSDAIQAAGDKGVLFVAAAGNGNAMGIGVNNDSTPTYPASFALPNIVAVAASNNRDELTVFSNFGLKSVLLAAPGEDILSTVIGGKYMSMDGTSMATPHVAGAAALLLSKEPNLKPTEIKERLTQSVDKIAGMSDKLISGGRLNLYKLLANTQE